MMKLINRKTSDLRYNINLEALTSASKSSCIIQEDCTEYDKIVESLNLTDNMRIALECRIRGLSYPEIGRVLSRTQSTVYEYFSKMQHRHAKIYE